MLICTKQHNPYQNSIMQKLRYQSRNSSNFYCNAKLMVTFASYIEKNIHKQNTQTSLSNLKLSSECILCKYRQTQNHLNTKERLRLHTNSKYGELVVMLADDGRFGAIST